MITLLQRLFLLAFFLASFAESYAKSSETLVDSCQTLFLDVIPLSDFNGFPISCMGGSDGDIQAYVSGGTPPYTYLWDNGHDQEFLFGLFDGQYTVTITDALACVFEATITLYAPLPVTYSANVIHQSAAGVDDGVIEMALFDGVPPYTVNWDNGMTGDTITGLAPGTYTANVIDANGCNHVFTETVNPSPCGGMYVNSTITSDYNGFAVSCPGMQDGSISAIAQGGIPPYTHAWSTGASGPDVIGLSDGWYYVTVTDSLQCVTIDTVFLAAPPYLMDSIGTINESASAALDGEAQLFTSGGVPPYSYNWDNGDSTAFITGLAGGNYQVTTTDINGCTLPSSAYVQVGCEGFFAYPQAISDYNGYVISCHGAADAIAEAIPNAGRPPFIYNWSNGDTTAQAYNLGEGWHSVTITDNINCTYVDSVYIYGPAQLSNTINTIDESAALNDGEIHVAIFDGVPPYNVAWGNGMNGDTLVGLAPGVYTGVISDANGCSINVTATVNPYQTQDCSNFTDSLSVMQTPCPENYGNGFAEAFPMGGVAPYTFSWSTGETTAAINGLGGGFYSVTIEDAQDCIITDSFEIFPPVDMMVNFTTVDESGPGANNGEIIATPYDPNISFLWSNGMSGSHITGLIGGSYGVYITHDLEGCSATDTIIVNTGQVDCSTFGDSIAILGDYNGYAISCSGAMDGSVEVFPMGGLAPYNFQWSNGHTASILTGVGEGWHYVTITDEQNCSIEDSVFLAAPPILSFTLSTVDETAAAASDGEIHLTISGGIPPYSVAWDNGMNGESIIGLAPGTYTGIISDEYGCSTSVTGIINPFQGPDCSNFTDSLLIIQTPCPENYGNGFAEVFPTGGVGPYTFLWNTGETTAAINGLGGGFYYVTIEDAQNCIITDSFYIYDPVDMTVNFTTVDESGPGTNDGEIIATPYDPNISFLWSNGMSGSHITGLIGGSYGVYITHDLEGCSATDTIIVNTGQVDCSTFGDSIAILGDYNGYAISCSGAMDGSVEVFPMGGLAPYNFQWSNGHTASILTGVGEGWHYVTITDEQNCSIEDSVFLAAPPILSFTLSTVDETAAAASDGEIHLTISGGIPPYSVAWDNGMNGESIIGLAPGTYTGIISDEFGCSTNVTAIINPFQGPDCSNFTDSLSVMQTPCPENYGNGFAEVFPMGGVGPYTFLWNTGETTAAINGLGGGFYSVTIEDAQNCIITDSLYIYDPVDMTVNFTTVDESGAGANNGEIMATPYDPNISFSWSNGMTGAHIVGLAAGTYTAYASHNYEGCLQEYTVVVNVGQPDCSSFTSEAYITADYNGFAVSCPGAVDGSGEVFPVGGIAPYNYQWSSGSTDGILTGVGEGWHYVTITDGQSCSVVDSLYLAAPPVLNVSFSTVDESFPGALNGEIFTTVTGGVGPYNYNWSNGMTGAHIFGLYAGTYSVDIVDVNGCSMYMAIDVMVGQPDCSSFTALLSTSYYGNYHIPCAGDSGGYVDAYATGGVEPYTYNWSNGVAGAHNAALVAGTYTVTITDIQGCELIMDTTLIAPTALTVTGSGTDVSAQGASDGEATATTTGGVEPYIYNWNNGVAGDTITGLSAGSYTTTVTDANGCTAETMVTITDPCEILFVDVFVTNNVSCVNDGSLSAYASGGAEPYSFNWSNGATGADVTGLSSGLYTVDISDSNGCSTTQSVYLSEPNPLAVIVYSIPESTVGNDGEATCFAVGGTSPYNYAWSNSAVGDTITGLTSGNYIVTVTDVLGCTAVSEVFVATNAPACDGFEVTMAITSNYNGNAISCAGATDGAAMAMVGGGTSPYTYLWEDGTTTQNNTALPMGTFMVTVTDAANCTAEGIVTLAPPPNIVVFVTSTAETTAGANDGTAYATAGGGTGSHTFAWSSGATTGMATGLVPGPHTVSVTDANGCFVTETVYVDPGIDPDSDQDGFVNSVDNCPTVYNPSQQDDDNDGQGNACTCDPDNAPLASSSGIHQSAYASYDAGWTHYCNEDGEVLLSLALDGTGAVISDNEVRLEIGQDIVSFYGDTIGFVTNGVGGVFLNRNWDVQPTTQPTSDVNVKYYFHQSDYEALNTALVGLNASPIPNVTDLKFFKITNAGLGIFPPIPSVPTGNLEMIDNGASPGINTWQHGSHGAVDHTAEYLVYSFSGGGGGGAENGDALPVELLYFRAALQGQSANLTWATAIEENNLGFEVQRNVGSQWETIGFVEGEGTTSVKQQYSFVDPNIQPGANYYRLKQVDTDGQFEYTEVRVVQLGKQNVDIAIYPNPTTGNFVVTNVLGTAKIYNSFGVVVKEFPIDQPRQTIDVSDLMSGMYYIEFDQGENNRTTQRFFKATE